MDIYCAPHYSEAMKNATPMPQGAPINWTVESNPADFADLVAQLRAIEWPAHVPAIVNRDHVAIIDPFDAYGPPEDEQILYPDEDDPEYYDYHRHP
jgi:hypothetical protein